MTASRVSGPKTPSTRTLRPRCLNCSCTARTESPGDLILGGTNLATQAVFDYLQILLDALAARGAHYAVASLANELDVELPMLNLQTGIIDDSGTKRRMNGCLMRFKYCAAVRRRACVHLEYMR